MKYLALILFCLWVLSHVLGAQETADTTGFADRFVTVAEHRLTQTVRYDPAYVVLDYPGGDVPADTGVCTDEVIRAYRALGVDLQRLVHEDMKTAFSAYPKLWGLKRPDKNIDHRRVPNLMVFFERKGQKLSISSKAEDYKPGDIVCWNLGGGITHIGIVSNQLSEDKKRYKIIHNVGAGQVLEDFIFNYKIIGHYRFSNQLK
jgi:uncharacterized protein YijF (DUF1287 family)